jgi:translation initiation factor IF-1
MRGTDTILAQARVIRVRSLRAFDVVLDNGHHLVGFLKKSDQDKKTIEVDQWIKISLSPFDLSKGQIVTED